jgi:hypothetical protein
MNSTLPLFQIAGCFNFVLCQNSLTLTNFVEKYINSNIKLVSLTPP